MYRVILLLVTTGVLGFANIPISITDTNPHFGDPNFQVPNCNPGDPNCVFGNLKEYSIQDFTLTGPAGGGTVGLWTLVIDTNYGVAPASGATSMPGFCAANPTTGTFPTCSGTYPLFMSDFLIQQGSNFYGVVMTSHHPGFDTPSSTDSYLAGNLYSAADFLTSHVGNPASGPVILDTVGKTLRGSGALSVAANVGCVGDNSLGTNPAKDCAEYKITDTFTVTSASNFFDPNGAFTIYASSADCFNSSLVLNQVPEPSGLIWLVPVLLLAGAYLRRRSLADVKVK